LIDIQLPQVIHGMTWEKQAAANGSEVGSVYKKSDGKK
jgi:hypothetical protein